jgi:hypothetical protein
MGTIWYFSYLNEESKKESWRRFAAAHQLLFMAGQFPFRSARVVGPYRNHQLELDTFNQNKQNWTRLSLYAVDRPDPKPLLDQLVREKVTAYNIVKMLAPHGLPVSVKATAQGQVIFYEIEGTLTDTKQLELVANLLADIADRYPVILALGGEAVPALQAIALEGDHSLQAVALQLLKDIGGQTQYRFSNRTDLLLCPQCLTRFGPHQVPLRWWQTITYYGCRTCGQSREFLQNDGPVIAILDNRPAAAQSQQQPLRINWLARRSLFDFDQVEIIQATDEEVERFAVQIGNDTDPVRKPRYQQMFCYIAAGCNLSENSRRILRRLFDQVEISTAYSGVETLAGEPGVEASAGEPGVEASASHSGVEALAGEAEIDMTPLLRKNEEFS